MTSLRLLASPLCPLQFACSSGPVAQQDDLRRVSAFSCATTSVYRWANTGHWSKIPAPDVAAATGEPAFEEHTGGHLVTPGEWNDFPTYAESYLQTK